MDFDKIWQGDAYKNYIFYKYKMAAFEAALLEITEFPRRNSEESHILRLVPSESEALSEAKSSSFKVS